LTRYLKRDFILDAVTNLPIFFFEASRGFPLAEGDMDSLFESKWYTVFMGLKLLRLYQAPKIQQSLHFIKNKVANVYFMHRLLLDNLLSWLMSGLKLLFCIHYFTCGYIGIDSFRGEQRFDSEMRFSYVKTFYFLTTTIAAVGYGDYSAFEGAGGDWALQMAYMTFVIIFGIILFSTVTNEIFTYRKLENVHELVKRKVKDTQHFLYAVEALNEKAVLPKTII